MVRVINEMTGRGDALAQKVKKVKFSAGKNTLYNPHERLHHHDTTEEEKAKLESEKAKLREANTC